MCSPKASRHGDQRGAVPKAFQNVSTTPSARGPEIIGRIPVLLKDMPVEPGSEPEPERQFDTQLGLELAFPDSEFTKHYILLSKSMSTMSMKRRQDRLAAVFPLYRGVRIT
jgi:hypothetical protein